jgi:hypothetical protein
MAQVLSLQGKVFRRAQRVGLVHRWARVGWAAAVTSPFKIGKGRDMAGRELELERRRQTIPLNLGRMSSYRSGRECSAGGVAPS